MMIVSKECYVQNGFTYADLHGSRVVQVWRREQQCYSFCITPFQLRSFLCKGWVFTQILLVPAR